MIAVITGDIINSREAETAEWLEVLKKALGKFGSAPKDWEIYRGDAFQLVVEDASEALKTAIRLKAAVRLLKGLDIRIAIGIGERNFDAGRVTQQNGTAFVNSGEKFETLKRAKLNLALKSDNEEFDREMNLYLKLGLIAMDSWTPNSAEAVKLALEFPENSQKSLGRKLGVKQNTVSMRLKRAYFEEIQEMEAMYRQKLKERL